MCISFGKAWLLVDLTLSNVQAKIRPNWQGWLYCVFVANANVNIPTFRLSSVCEISTLRLWMASKLKRDGFWGQVHEK